MSGYPTCCLVNLPCEGVNNDRLEPPLGLLFLGACLREIGAAPTVLDLASSSYNACPEQVPDGFDIYGISACSTNYHAAFRLLSELKRRNPRALFLIGGPHASALPQAVAKNGFDCVVIGEGERAICAIVDQFRAGIRPPRIVHGTAVDPLDALPLPAFDLVDLSTYSRELDGYRCVSIQSSRGCPYTCSFCNSNIMGAGRRIRFFSAERVIQQIRAIKNDYGVHHFRFQDDVFTFSRKRIEELAPRLARENIVYRCFARINNFTREMAVMLRSSGCIHVSFGVETGSPKLLAKNAMDKRQTTGQIRAALGNAHAAGLRTRIFLMVGFPGETDETIAETLALVRACSWEEFSVYPLIAYPGTPMHDRPSEFGITAINRDYSEYFQIGKDMKAAFTIRTNTFDENKVRCWRDHVVRQLLADGRVWAGSALGFQ